LDTAAMKDLWSLVPTLFAVARHAPRTAANNILIGLLSISDSIPSRPLLSS
jgi:hypothetical protein